MKSGDLITLLAQEGYYIVIEGDDPGSTEPSNWWKIQSLNSGNDYGPFWEVEPCMVLVSESR